MSISYKSPPELGLKKEEVERMAKDAHLRLDKQEDETERHKRDIATLKDRETVIRWIMVAVIIVLLVAFIGALLTVFSIIQDYIGTKTASTQELVNKINEQGSKIDLLEQNYINVGADLIKLKIYFGIR